MFTVRQQEIAIIDPEQFPAVPEELLRSLDRSRADIAAGRLRDAEQVDREIQERVETMKARAPKMRVG